MRGVDEETETKGNDDSKKKGEALETYCVNLNKKARDGKIDPVIGRNSEINRAIQVLCRRQKNNPLFVGEAGVGKTAIAEGLAKRIVDSAKCRKCWRRRRCSRSTWARCSRAPATAAISRSG